MASDRRRYLQAVQAESRKIKDPHARKVFRRSAVQIGLVETGLRNLHYGDADSVNIRQERASVYGKEWAKTGGPYNLEAIAGRLRREFEQHYQPGEKSYQVSADIQRPREDLRHRYQDVAPEAARILKSEVGSAPNQRQGSSYTTTTQTIPGVDRSSDRQALQQAYLQNRHDPNALLDLAAGLQGAQDTPSRTVKSRVKVQGKASSGGSPKGGVATFEGKKVAAWIKPALEYARKQGWQGTVTSGYRSEAEQRRIYNSGVRPAAKPGTSNHEFTQYPGGAIDASDAETLAKILRGTKYGKRLKWAGSKDPVHFSHPRNGSY